MYKYSIIRFIRSTFRPINPEIAQKWYDRARYAYMFVAFQVLGIGFYLVQREKRLGAAYEVEETQVERAVRVLGLTNVKVITLGQGAPEPYLIDGETVKKRREEKKQEILDKFSV